MDSLKPATKMSGGVRIAPRRSNQGSQSVDTPISKLLTEKRTRINQKIQALVEVNFIRFQDVIAQGIKTFSERLVREVWADRDIYREFRADRSGWLMKTVFKAGESGRLEVADVGALILRVFKLRGQQLILSFLDSLDSILVERKGTGEEQPATINMNRFKAGLEYFGLGGDTRVSFGAIRRAYTERLANSADHSRDNEEFMYLRDNYSDYLQSQGVSS